MTRGGGGLRDTKVKIMKNFSFNKEAEEIQKITGSDRPSEWIAKIEGYKSSNGVVYDLLHIEPLTPAKYQEHLRQRMKILVGMELSDDLLTEGGEYGLYEKLQEERDQPAYPESIAALRESVKAAINETIQSAEKSLNKTHTTPADDMNKPSRVHIEYAGDEAVKISIQGIAREVKISDDGEHNTPRKQFRSAKTLVKDVLRRVIDDKVGELLMNVSIERGKCISVQIEPLG